MSATGDKLPLTEWIFTRYTALSQWATSDLRRRPDGSQPRGCSSSIGVLKALLFLLMIVCFPVFALPMMLSRLFQVGFTGLRYGAAAGVKSGDEARWAHGSNGDTADFARAGVTAEDIMLRDPGFQVSALAGWAMAATALLRDSLVSGEPTGARTFMSNGLYQAHEALLDLQTAAATATSLGSMASAIGASVSSQASSSGSGGSELSWMSWAGRYDLDFTRPAGARTDPAAALASRTCAACGAAYRSDLATHCAHCRAERPLAWGEWRPAGITAGE